jgi:DNA-binding HxlR family transcriptional regulator
MTRLPGGQVELGTWGSLGLLADLWEAGVVEALSRGPRSPTELVQRQRGLSYHQVNRKVGQFKEAGFLRESKGAPKGQRSYTLTEKACRTMGLVADVGRWRACHLPDFGEEGLTPEEMATIVRTALPLATLAAHAGKGLGIRVSGSREAETWAGVDEEGILRPVDEAPALVSAEVAGDVGAWLSALLDSESQLTVDGDAALVADCLDGIYAKLWTPSPF